MEWLWVLLYFRAPEPILLSAEAGEENKSGKAHMPSALCDTFSTRFIALASCECNLGQRQQKFSQLSVV